MTRYGKFILKELLKLNVSNNFGKITEELKQIAEILENDLEGESEQTLTAAFEKLRKNCKWWPKISEILQACDEVRLAYSRNTEPTTSVEIPATPGTGWLCNKFLEESRTADEFSCAQYTLRQEYIKCRDGKNSWPNNKEDFEAMLSFLFGDRPRKRVLFSV